MDAGAIFARTGVMSDDDVAEAEEIRDAGGTMVTFIVVFYVGYCYTRYNSQFDDVQLIMRASAGLDPCCAPCSLPCLLT